MGLLRLVLPLAAVTSLLSPPAAAQCDWQEIASDTSESGDFFGSAAAIEGTRLVVGAPEELDCGKIFAFDLVGGQWVQTAGILASDAPGNGRFGSSIALEGDTLMVGAQFAHAVYLFERQGMSWIETAKLEIPQAAAIGYPIALCGDTALFGDSENDTAASKGGAVFVMERVGSTWTQSQFLLASDPQQYLHFGATVDLEGDLAVIGAKGKFYIFERAPGGFVEIASFQPAYYYMVVRISGEWIFVGDTNDSRVAVRSGAVYVYRKVGGQWSQVQKLKASDAQYEDFFGASFSVVGSRALIGAPYDGALDKGAAYLFELGPSGWTETTKLLNPTHDAWARYGLGIDLDEQGNAVVGAPGHHSHDALPRAYTYVFDGPDCNGNAVPDFCDLAQGTSLDGDGDGIPDECTCEVQRYCVANDNSTGAPGSITALGTPSVSANDWTLRASSCPPGQFGLFFYGQNQNQVPFGDGRRCVDGQIFRLPAVPISPAGEATWALDFAAPPQPEGAITPGSTWNFQFWYRDPAAGGSGFNLSQGMMVGFCL